ncbi:MAG: ShlB/FhaC/HecB family hemolysin secretion/activation protein [Synechococcales cyanobacterium RM1_1_8]|nr:ShlB/FhaC/HecB family hemolysin secretion/activation protein [Synechococcales cyanobacterium RM1_1_8]
MSNQPIRDVCCRGFCFRDRRLEMPQRSPLLLLALAALLQGLSPQLAQSQANLPSTRDTLAPPLDNPLPIITPAPLPPEELEIQPGPTPAPTTAPTPAPTGTTPDSITVERFEVLGNSVLTEAQIEAVLAPFLNRPLSQVELIQAANALTNFYIEQGYVTSGVIVPEHDFENGVVKLQVIEGSLEEIEVLGTQRLRPDYVRDRLRPALTTPINRIQLLEALQLLRLDPLIASLTAELSNGTETGTSLLRVQVEEADSFSVDASLDNRRSPSVGSWQRRLQLQQLNLTGRGDRFNFGYGNSQGSNSIDVGYSYPLNGRNGSLGLNFSYTGSDIIEAPFDVLDINARSTVLELGYRQPLVQTLRREFALGVSLLHRRTQARFIEELDAPFPSPGADDEGRTIVNELRFSQDYNQRGDRSFLGLRSQFAAGLPILGATTQDEAPDATFLLWQGQAQYGRLLAPETLFLARSSVQLASRPLVPLAQFGLGGSSTVRGYRQDVLLGDGGWLASAEVRLPLLKAGQRQASQLQLVPFFDLGGVFNRGDRPEPDPSFIASTGLGLLFESGDRRFSGRVEYGLPLVEVSNEGESLQARGLHASFRYRLF